MGCFHNVIYYLTKFKGLNMINITELIEILKRIKEDEGDLDVFQVYNEEPLPLEDKTVCIVTVCGMKLLAFT
jgi:hypothetical protein